MSTFKAYLFAFMIRWGHWVNAVGLGGLVGLLVAVSTTSWPIGLVVALGLSFAYIATA